MEIVGKNTMIINKNTHKNINNNNFKTEKKSRTNSFLIEKVLISL